MIKFGPDKKAETIKWFDSIQGDSKKTSKSGPKTNDDFSELEKRNPEIGLMCPFCQNKEAKSENGVC